VGAGYRIACSGERARTLFANEDDAREFRKRDLVSERASVVIAGSCIDVGKFVAQPEQTGDPLVVLPSRMLRDKGVEEFAEAARTLRQQGVAARFALVGDSDDGNPTTIRRTRLRELANSGAVEWWG